jgi:hypothetical protein
VHGPASDIVQRTPQQLFWVISHCRKTGQHEKLRPLYQRRRSPFAITVLAVRLARGAMRFSPLGVLRPSLCSSTLLAAISTIFFANCAGDGRFVLW